LGQDIHFFKHRQDDAPLFTVQPPGFVLTIIIMSDTKSRNCRSAIALSNIGVVLLERGCFQAASESLKDAASLIKTTFDVDGATCLGADSTCSISQKVHLARQRLSDAQNQRPKQSNQSPITVQVWHGSSLCETMIREFSDDASTAEAFAILIEDFDFSVHDNGALTSIVLLNLGVAYYCLSKSQRQCSGNDSARHRRYSNGALRLFRMSYSLCSKHIHIQKQNGEVPQLLHLTSLLLLSTFIIRMLREHRRPEKESRPFYIIHQQLSSWMINETSLGLANGAAAAA
jgi:hypothetical protein